MSPTIEVLRRVIQAEQARSGLDRVTARSVIARRAGISPGSLENLLRGRLKNTERVEGRVNVYLERRIAQEIQGLEHDISVLRASRGNAADADILAAEAAVAAARNLLVGRSPSTPQAA